jgi:hypothetical protein
VYSIPPKIASKTLCVREKAAHYGRLRLSKNPLRWAFSPIWHRPAGRSSPHFLRKIAAGRGVFDHFHTENGQKRWVSKIAETAILTFLTS